MCLATLENSDIFMKSYIKPVSGDIGFYILKNLDNRVEE